MQTIKILVVGPSGSGKTQFIESISSVEVVSTEYDLDCGILKIDMGLKLYLFGEQGASHLDLQQKLSADVLGLVLMVNSTHPTPAIQSYLNEIHKFFRKPYVIAANFQDQAEALSVDAIRRLYLTSAPIIPCNALDPASVKHVLIQLVYQVLQSPMPHGS